jgi:DNA repair protein RecN (Recombination protein N)
MLTELRVENFAIIDQLELQFSKGLISFTGETGAGKSILMVALDILLGSRGDTTHIRSGDDRASVEAVFRIDPVVRESVHSLLNQEELLDDPNNLTLSRELRRNGRNVARVNGHSVNVSILRELGEYLVDIHGQSEHLSLLRVREHLGLLDRYANIEDTLSVYQLSYRRLKGIQRELNDLRQSERESTRRADLLSYQIDEIASANLETGEDEQLKNERNRLANAETLTSLCQEALLVLDEGIPNQPTAIDLIGQAVESIEKLVRLDPSKSSLNIQVTGLFDGVSELSRSLRYFMDSIEYDPQRLEQVEERLNLINTLKRKYGDTIEEILEFAQTAVQELETITLSNERIAELETLEKEVLIRLGEQGLELSKIRHQAANHLVQALESELNDLRMSQAHFRVDIHQQPDSEGISLNNETRVAFNRTGIDQIEFFIETNPGEGFKPLVKIASGGETSRLMLALKNVLARADNVPTLVFDEIDQGIGGRVGTVVGQKLRMLTDRHQVLCITHLPQLAAYAQQHFRVHKVIQNGRTITKVELVEGEARLEELASMMGEISVGTLRSAQEILHAVGDLPSEA